MEKEGGFFSKSQMAEQTIQSRTRHIAPFAIATSFARSPFSKRSQTATLPTSAPSSKSHGQSVSRVSFLSLSIIAIATPRDSSALVSGYFWCSADLLLSCALKFSERGHGVCADGQLAEFD